MRNMSKLVAIWRGGSLSAKISHRRGQPQVIFLVYGKLNTFSYLTVKTASSYVQSFSHGAGI